MSFPSVPRSDSSFNPAGKSAWDTLLDSDASDIDFTQSGTGAVSLSVAEKIQNSVPLTPEDFGAVGNGTTDDLTPLTKWINELLANTNCRGYIRNKIYATSGSLPDINVSGIQIEAIGPFGLHDVGSNSGAVIKAISGCTGTILTIAPTEGASAQYLFGIKLKGVTFDCNDIAAKGLVTKSMRYCEFDVCVLNASTTGWEMNVSTTLGEATSSQYNVIRYVGRQTSAAGDTGVSLRLIGDSNGNPSFNVFQCVDIIQKDELGIIEENADNNYWLDVRVFRATGGSATNSIEWRGGASEAVSCRNETYGVLSTTVAAIAKGTGTYTVGAKNIVIHDLDYTNNTPVPTEETGTTIFDNQVRTYTPTVTAGTGTFTTVSATGRYIRRRKSMFLKQTITITTNGTAATNVQSTIPEASAAGAGVNILMGNVASSSVSLRGAITAGSSTLSIIKTKDESYPGGDGLVLSMSGEYETA